MTRPARDDKRKLWVAEIRLDGEWHAMPICSVNPPGQDMMHVIGLFEGTENTRVVKYGPLEENSP